MNTPPPPPAQAFPAPSISNRPWTRRIAGVIIATLLGQSLLPLLPAQAQIAPHQPAPAGQRAIMDTAQNGVPIAHIAPPSPGGVSRNQFGHFNVAPNGLILNNSNAPAHTELGGWISANPQLGHTPARVIVNEVLGPNPSHLLGTTEVAGQRAGVVIANPNGVTCDGCGFLNTSRATLTSGQPQYAVNGALHGFDIRRGQVNVSAQGLQAANLEQLDLLARGLVIEGEVWTDNLNLLAGANQVLYDTLQASAQSGSGAPPRFAIDIKALGGMFANHIHLLATEQGLGVNSTGRIAALQGNLVLSANGDLTLKHANARQHIALHASGTLTNTGTLQAGGNLAATAQTLRNPSAQINAGGAITLQATRIDNRDGAISASGAIDIASSGALDNTRGQIVAASALTLGTGDTTNRDGVIGAQRITANTGALDNHGGQILATGHLGLATQALTNNAGLLHAGGDLHIDTHGQTLVNANSGANVVSNDSNDSNESNDSSDRRATGIIAAGAITIDTGTLDNDGGLIASTNSAAGAIATHTGTLDNDGGLIASTNSAAGAIAIHTGTLDNDGGLIASTNSAAGAIAIDTGTPGNDGGLIASTNSAAATSTSAENSNSSSAGITVNAENLRNSGEISGPQVALNVRDALSNNGTGLIDAARLHINAGTIDNHARLYGDRLTLQARAINNSGPGVIAARESMQIGAHTLDNTDGGLIYSLGDMSIGGNATGGGTSPPPDSEPPQPMHELHNRASRIEAYGDLVIDAAHIHNRNGGIVTRREADDPVHQQWVQPVGEPTRYPVALCSGIGGAQDDNSCIVHPDRYGQRSTVEPVRTTTCTYDESGAHCTTQNNYSWDSAIFTQFNIPPVSTPPPAEPAGGCTHHDHNLLTMVDTPGAACDQWRSASASWTASYDAALDALDPAISAYNASVDEDNRRQHFEDYTWYKVTSIDSREVLDQTRPGQILSGGAMRFTGSATNHDSHIVAGGTLDVIGPAVQNIATQGEQRTDFSGTAQLTEVESCGLFGSSHCRRWRAINPYQPAPERVMTPLPTVRYEQQVGNQARILTLDPAENGDTAGLATLRAQLLANIPTPDNQLFDLASAPGQRHLIETDPRFTNYRHFLNTDYLLQAFKRDPLRELKRYGDGFIEQQLVNDQILALTGRRYLHNYSDTHTQFTALMDAGIAFARQYQLSPGIALTAEQMAVLTTDIVWLTRRSVTLADGTAQDVLVPQVYLRRPHADDLQPDGSLIAGNGVHIAAEQQLVNSGTIAGNTVTATSGGDLVNAGGTIHGQHLLLDASNDLKNLSGRIVASGDDPGITLLAGRDIVLQTATLDNLNDDASGSRTSVQRIATVQGGNISIKAGRDLVANGAQVTTDSTLVASAERDITIGTVVGQTELDIDDASGMTQQGRSGHIRESTQIHQTSTFSGRDIALTGAGAVQLTGAQLDASNALVVQGKSVDIAAAKNRASIDVQTIGRNSFERNMRDDEALVASNLTARNMTIRATGTADDHHQGNASSNSGNITITGSNLITRDGPIAMAASNDITIVNDSTRHASADEHYRKSSGLLQTVTTTSSSRTSADIAHGSTISGNTLDIQAGRNLQIKGSAVVGDNGTNLVAANNASIDAATTTLSHSSTSKLDERGLLSGGGFGISYGQRTTTSQLDLHSASQSQARSLVGSNRGPLTVRAGNAVSITGTDLGADDVELIGKFITAEPGYDIQQSQATTTIKQNAFTLSIGGSAVQSAHTTHTMAQSAGQTGNPRVKALAATTAGLSIANAADDSTDLSVNLTLGRSQSKHTQAQTSRYASASTITARKSFTVKATGGGRDSNINLIGADISVGDDMHLKADNQVNFAAAQHHTSQHSSSTSSNAAVGIAFQVSSSGVALGFTGSAGTGSGNQDSASTIQRNTRLQVGKRIVLDSAGDTNITGATIHAPRVEGDVGGNLHIESLQDTDRYTSRDSNTSGSVTIGLGAGVTASIGQSRIDSNYASVGETSGIKAGDGGFNINVKGNTVLKGGVIASTDTAVNAGRNSFTTGGTLDISDIDNSARYHARATSISIGTTPQAGKASLSGLGIGSGNEAGSASSTTTGGISGIAGNQAVRSTDATSGIARIFDPEKVQREVNAERAVTEAFTREAPKAIAHYANSQGKQLLELAGQQTDPDQQAAFKAEAAKWEEGGSYRVALHAVTGGLAGGVGGAVGAGASARAAPLINELQDGIEKGLQAAGMDAGAARGVAQGITGLAAGGIGVAVGGTPGAAAAVAVDVNNRQLHPDETKWVKENAKRFAREQGISEQEAEQRLAQQAQRQLQNGVEGEQDAQAMAFLRQGKGMLPADPDCPTCGPGFMFFATPEQKANPGMYANFLPETADFYVRNGLIIPGPEQIAAGVQRENAIRDTAETLTKAAPVAASAVALAGLSPTVLTWVLANPDKATTLGIISAEAAAAIKSGAVTPVSLAETGPVKVGQALATNTGTGKLIGTIDNLTPVEQKFVNEMIAGGKTVQVIPTSTGRTADFVIDGVKYELKTMTNVANQTSDGLSKALSSTIMNARGQSGNIIIDARGQAGMTAEIAERGIGRAMRADELSASGAKVQGVTIITSEGTVHVSRKP